jgi:large subunit ribosomal protein L13
MWVLVDAEGQSLGRMAAKVAHVLRGKHRPTFSPHQLCGDHVVIINASKLSIPQKKLMQKMYRKHSGYIGHLRSKTMGKMMEESPEKVVQLAVKGMLPSNRLRPQILKRLHVFTDENHSYAAQKPASLITSS